MSTCKCFLHSSLHVIWVRITKNGSSAREIVEVDLEEQSDENGVRESEPAAQDDLGEGIPSWRLDDGSCQAAQRQETYPAERSRMEVGGVPPGDVRRWRDRCVSLYGEERLLEAGRDRK